MILQWNIVAGTFRVASTSPALAPPPTAVAQDRKHGDLPPMPLYASTFRRRMLMASMMETGELKDHGLKFMKNQQNLIGNS